MAGMLDDKVVVISGVGPALGTTLARRCAEAGADLVLAARTVERLEDVAKQITDIGRRAVDGRHRHHRRGAGQQSRRGVAQGLRQGRRVDQQRIPGAVDETVGQHHLRSHAGRDRADGVRRAADDPGLHSGAGRGEGVGGERELDGRAPLAGQVRRVQDGQVGAAGHVAVAGHRAGRAGHPGELCSARLYLGRHAARATSNTRPASTAPRSTRSTRRPR